MLKINLFHPPPTAEQIEAERKRLKKLPFSPKGLLLLIILPICSWCLYLWLVNHLPTEKHTIIFLVVSLNFLVILRMAKGVKGSVKPAFEAKDLIPVTKVNPRRYSEIPKICRLNGLCETYRKAVVKQGRSLIVAEANMIERWVCKPPRKAGDL